MSKLMSKLMEWLMRGVDIVYVTNETADDAEIYIDGELYIPDSK